MEKLLNIKKDDNDNIINADEVLKSLENINNDLNSIEYLESLLNYLEFQNLGNKEALVSAIKAKLVEFKSLSEEELSSKAALNQATKYNEDLKRINVISTSKYDNDSGKDIEYISITHEDGSVEMLVCEGKSSINDYIKDHADDVATKSADEIFKYFKQTVHNELKFYKESEFETINPNLANSAIIKEDDAKALEVEEVHKYAARRGIEDDIKVTVDPNGERIYIVGDAIMKFHSDFHGERVMDVIQESKIKANTNDYASLLSELDEPENNDIFQKYDTVEEAQKDAKPTETDEFITIDFDRVFPEFNIERLKNLIIQKQVYEAELNADELGYIAQSIAFLIGSMMERAERGELQTEEEITLEDYMHDIVDKYEAIEEGRMNEDELSETDKQLAAKYLENKEKIRALGLQNKPKMLELRDGNNKSGVAAVIILLEMLAIAGFVLLFLSIAI